MLIGDDFDVLLTFSRIKFTRKITIDMASKFFLKKTKAKQCLASARPGTPQSFILNSSEFLMQIYNKLFNTENQHVKNY